MPRAQTQLLMDSRTHWRSTLNMIRAFLKNEAVLRQFYDGREKPEKFPLEDNELSALRSAVESLECAEVAIKRLSREDMTLSLADIAIEVSSRSVFF